MIRAMKVLIAKGGLSFPSPTHNDLNTNWVRWAHSLTRSAWQNGPAQAIPAAMDFKPKSH